MKQDKKITKKPNKQNDKNTVETKKTNGKSKVKSKKEQNTKINKNKKEISIEKEILDNRKNQKHEDIEIINQKPKLNSYKTKFKNLKIKYKKDPKKFVITVSSLLLLLSLMIGTSYAALTYLSKTGKTTKIESGNLALELKNEENSINLSGALPQEDKEALEQNDEYEFTIQNTGSIKASYKVTLDNTCDLNKSYTINGEEKTPDKCVPNEYIKVGIKKGEGEYKVLEYDKEKNEYILETGILNETQEETYKMKIWLDLDTPNDYNPKDIYTIIYTGKLNIKYEQTTSDFNQNTYIVKYHPNGGRGTMEDTTFIYNEEKTLAKNTFTKTGENFLGWSTSQTNNNIIYSDEETIKNLTNEDKGIVNLYAVWGTQINTINLIINNGTTTQYEKHVNNRGSVVFNITPTEGYINPEITCTNNQKTIITSNRLTIKDVTESSTCTVSYKPSTYKIAYKMNRISERETESVTYDTVKNITTPTKEFIVNITNSASGTLSATKVSKDQTFKGWTTSSSDGLVLTAKKGTTSSPTTSWDGSLTTATYFKNLNSNSGTVTLTANWTPVALTLPTITKTGYTCGFATTSGATSIRYESGASYTPSATTGSVTLYTVCNPKSKSITYQITYDTSKYPGPSSTYKTDTYQSLSKTSSSLVYGTSETITASPAYPDDRYTGSVSCTNGLTATLTAGSGTTARTDSIKITNNSNTTTSSVCTIKYTPKWKGVAHGTYTAGNTFYSSNYSNNSSNWTVARDNGDNIGLVYNDVFSGGYGSYENASKFLEDAFAGTSVLDNDIAQGGIKKQTNGYITTDGGIKTGLSSYNYWTGSGKFYNSTDRNKYTATTTKYLYGVSQTRGDGSVGTTTVNTGYKTSTSVEGGTIISTSNSNIASISGGTVKFANNSVSCVTEGTSSKLALQMTRIILGYDCSPSSTKLCYKHMTFKYDDGTYTLDESQPMDSDNVATSHHYVCGGDYAGKRVVYSYNSSTSFKYGNEYTGTGWGSTSSWSRDNAENYLYKNDDGEYWSGRFAGRSYTCGPTTPTEDCIATTVSGNARRIRHYRYNTYETSDGTIFCKKRKKCTISAGEGRNIYYRAYIVVRER